MVNLNKLSYQDYQATFQAPMLDVTTIAAPILDIWPYVEAVPTADLKGCTLSDGLVPYVYQHPSETFLHVLVATDDADVFLVIVIELNKTVIYGHYLLDLPKLYGITTDSEE